MRSCSLLHDVDMFVHREILTNLKRSAELEKSGPLLHLPPPQRQSSQALKLGIELDDMNLCAKAYAERANPNSLLPGTNGCTAVAYCVQMDRPEIAEFIITKGVSNKHVSWGFTLFHFAIMRRKVGLLRLLLEKHPSSLFQNDASVHPVHIAVLQSAPECLKLMLNHAYPSGLLPSACSSGQVDHTKITSKASVSYVAPAIEYLANITVGNNFPSALQTQLLSDLSQWSSLTPLHLAAQSGDLENARELLAAGSQVNAVTSIYQAALHLASRAGDSDMAKLLLKAGAQIHIRDIGLKTPPMEAAKEGHSSVLKPLLRKGVDLEACSNEEETILHLAAGSGRMKSLAYIINRARGVVDLERKCERGLSVLCWAFTCATSGQSFLLNLAPNPKAYTLSRSNVLSAAISNASMTVKHIKMLLKRIPSELRQQILCSGAPNIGTPLYVACTETDIPRAAGVINLLLDTGALIDEDGGYYGSPLIAACTIGRLSAVKILILRGAQTTFTRHGKPHSPLDAAKNFTKILDWLLVGRFKENSLRLT